jgi:DNA-binding Lrp family transcriptional regulator
VKKLGSQKIKAYILLVTAVGKETEVINSLKSLQEVKEANALYGEYDGIVEVEANDMQHLNKVVMQIRRNSAILKTVTLIVM